MNDIPFAAVKAASPSFVDAFVRRYLPDAKKHGGWWKARVPWRPDKNPSLGIHTSGQWQDFSRGDKGDLVDLLARLDGCPGHEAAKRLAVMMGIQS